MSAASPDHLFEGRLRVHQPAGGYRFSIDAVLLAHQARPHPGDCVLDLGTGCGIIPLIMCYRHACVSVWAVEIQPALWELAARNIAANGLQERIKVLNADLRRLPAVDLPELFDLIVTNPPYRRLSSGRLNPDAQRAVARHELSARLEDVLSAAGRRLRPGGRFAAIYTTERLPEILAGMQSVAIEPKVLRPVYTKAQCNAKRVLIEGVKGGRGGITVATPLVIHGPDGEYSDEVAAMFRP